MTESSSNRLLDKLQRKTFGYFLNETNAENGLIVDRTDGAAPASIAATGLALAAYPVGVERKFISRGDAAHRTLTCLRFFWNSPQGTEKDATGYKGFYYHFLDMQTGRRVWKCELSSVDTTFLLAGMLAAAEYFTLDNPDETEIRELATKLFARVDWQWMLNGGPTVSHGWKPESGFIKYRWNGYSEALLLYMLGLGSTTHPLPAESYSAWASSYKWKKIYGTEFLYSGPLFTHQLSHVWIDFRGIRDEFMRDKKSDYFENSRRATQVQREYSIRNPMKFTGYADDCWGLTASDGPGCKICTVDGVERRFYSYLSRGAPYGPDDGTIAPWAVVASLPFAPDIVLPAIEQFDRLRLIDANPYGFKTSFNRTFPDQNADSFGWISPGHCGINQGPIVLMIENYRTDMLWALMRKCPYLVTGLRRAGFEGGWL
ncbi:MAG TPA: glucoamylase family protein [Gemmatimonadaceae bacterium]